MNWTFFIGLFLGFLLGILASFMANYFFAFEQFKGSLAKHRLDMVQEATNEIVEFHKANRIQLESGNEEKETAGNRLRNRYRYSLGPMIDQLNACFGKYPFSKEGPWPCLTETNRSNLQGKPLFRGCDSIDRWEWFNKYVRPVIEDINTSSFLSNSPILNRYSESQEVLERLDKLTSLCKQLESSVSALDAVLGKEHMVRFEDIRITVLVKPQTGLNKEDEKVISQLSGEYQKLYNAWIEWLRVAKTGI